MMVTREEIEAGLRHLGLKQNDSVLVHSSLSSFGQVENGADSVIDAIINVVGPGGTVAMPSFPAIWRGMTHYEYLKSQPVFDLRVIPSGMGKITELFRCRSEVRRSIHGCHSVAVWGRLRDKFIADHGKYPWPCGEKSPFWENCMAGGKILLLGIGQRSNTTLHTVEEIGGAPVLTKELYYPVVIDYEGLIHTCPTFAHIPGIARDYDKMDAVCEEKKIMTRTKIGQAEVRLIEAAPLLETGIALLKDDPEFLFKEKC